MSDISISLTREVASLEATIHIQGEPIYRIALRTGHAETVLDRMFNAATAGAFNLPSRPFALKHFTFHQWEVDASCGWCRFEGRILAAQGRFRIPPTHPRAPTPGRASQDVIADLLLAEQRKRSLARSPSSPLPAPIRSTSVRAEDLL